ncbi:MAG: LCCL domain-containing protein [Polyangiales bacterium]
MSKHGALVALVCAAQACGPVAIADGLRPYGSNIPTYAQTATSVTWSTDSRDFRGMNGVRVRFDCPARSDSVGSVYGADLFTDDSPVCEAGRFAGRINAAGGVVVIEVRPGASQYVAATRNGVTTNAYAAYDGSFIVL